MVYIYMIYIIYIYIYTRIFTYMVYIYTSWRTDYRSTKIEESSRRHSAIAFSKMSSSALNMSTLLWFCKNMPIHFLFFGFAVRSEV